MEIKLGQYDVLEAIEEYVKKNYGFELDCYNQLEEYPTISYLKRIYAPKKHKNGKVMKHPDYGYVLSEVVKTEQKYISFGEDCDFSFYITGE